MAFISNSSLFFSTSLFFSHGDPSQSVQCWEAIFGILGRPPTGLEGGGVEIFTINFLLLNVLFHEIFTMKWLWGKGLRFLFEFSVSSMQTSTA